MTETLTETLTEGEVFEGDLDEGSKGILISSLIRMYKDPFGSILREYVANALDARDNAGSSEPVLVDLSRSLLVIEDCGIGLSPLGVKKYVSVGYSTKRESKKSTGAFGLGSKSALSIFNEFYLRTRYEGTETHLRIAVSLPARDALNIKVLSSKKTTEGNGTAVFIPLESYGREDLVTEHGFKESILQEEWSDGADSATHAFYEKLKLMVPFWTPGSVRINYMGEPFVGADSFYEKEFFANGYIAKGSDFEGLYLEPGIYVKMGHNTYPTGERMNRDDNNIYLMEIPNKAVDTVPNREQLIFNDKTKNVINALKDRIKEAAQAEVDEAVSTEDVAKKLELYFAIKKRNIVDRTPRTSDWHKSFYAGVRQFALGHITTPEEAIEGVYCSMRLWNDKMEKEAINKTEAYIPEEYFDPEKKGVYDILLVGDERPISFYTRRVKRYFDETRNDGNVGYYRRSKHLLILKDTIDKNDALFSGAYNMVNVDEFLEAYKTNLEYNRPANNGGGRAPVRQQVIEYSVSYFNDGELVSRDMAVEDILNLGKRHIYYSDSFNTIDKLKSYSIILGTDDFVVINLTARQKKETADKRFNTRLLNIKDEVRNGIIEENQNEETKRMVIFNKVTGQAERSSLRSLVNYLEDNNEEEVDEILDKVNDTELRTLLEYLYEGNKKYGRSIKQFDRDLEMRVKDVQIPVDFQNTFDKFSHKTYPLLTYLGHYIGEGEFEHALKYVDMVNEM